MNGLALLKRVGLETNTSLAVEVLPNLRDVKPWALEKLKRELRKYDISTKKWDKPRARKVKVAA